MLRLPQNNDTEGSPCVATVKQLIETKRFTAVVRIVSNPNIWLSCNEIHGRIYMYTPSFSIPRPLVKGDLIEIKIELNRHGARWGWKVCEYHGNIGGNQADAPYEWRNASAAEGVTDTKTAINYLESVPVSVCDPAKFVEGRQSLTIYFDETFRENSFFALGGIVWRDRQPDTNKLPNVPNHYLTTNKMPEPVFALAKLISCPDAMPFLFKFPWRAEEDQPTAYWRCVQSAIVLLLGWIFPFMGHPVQIRICAEEYGEGGAMPYFHHDNELKGALAQLAMRCPARFKSYSIASFQWYPKNPPFEYLSWADLLCKTLHSDYTDIFRAARIPAMPCYAEVSDELIEQLISMDSQEPAYAGKLLDFVGRDAKTVFEKNIEKGIKVSVAGNPRFRDALTLELASRYREKNRVVGNLSRQIAGYFRLVPEMPDNAPTIVRLSWLAFRLQDVNHRGNPEQGIPIAEQYEKLRSTVLPDHRELVAYMDTILAVHCNDLFNFDKAKIINESLVNSSCFSALDRYSAARAKSSLGQSFSIKGMDKEAEQSFADAIQLFEAADFSANPGMKSREIDQTKVYRAINALDFNLASAVNLLKEVIGDDLVASARRLAQSTAVKDNYHHHLLVRSLYWGTEEEMLNIPCQQYMGSYGNWSYPKNEDERQHPWELIDLYRGILCLERGGDQFDEIAVDCFERAITLSLKKNHGATLKLIAGVVATVALCSGIEVREIDNLGNQHERDYKSEAIKAIDFAGNAMPCGKESISHLREIINAPSKELINDALKLLPFNYR